MAKSDSGGDLKKLSRLRGRTRRRSATGSCHSATCGPPETALAERLCRAYRLEEFAYLQLEAGYSRPRTIAPRRAPAPTPILFHRRRDARRGCWTTRRCARAALRILREISCVEAPCSSTAEQWPNRSGHCGDGPPISIDRADGFFGRGLDAGNLAGDLPGGLGGLPGKGLHLGGHDRESLAGLAARAASIVAFSASRLVWPAMPLISSTTSPIRAAAFDQFADPRIGLLCLADGLMGDARRLLHLAADLVDRGRHSSLAAETAATLADASSEDAATEPAS